MEVPVRSWWSIPHAQPYAPRARLYSVDAPIYARPMRRLVVTLAVVAGLAPGASARAGPLSAPSTTRLVGDAVLRLSGDATPGTLRAVALTAPGARCPASPDVDPGAPGLITADASGDRVTVRLTARRTLVCAFRQNTDAVTGERTIVLVAQRAVEAAFGLPDGIGPLLLSGPAKTFMSLLIGADGRTRAIRTLGYGSFSCARKRFLLPAPLSLATWVFHRSGAVRADNSDNYDAPVPPRYGGHATLTADGTLRTATADQRLTIAGVPTHVRPGDTLVSVKVRFSAPGYRPCSRRSVTLRGVIPTSDLG
jgi:hypothetical protein